jgi:hypothetical protein
VHTVAEAPVCGTTPGIGQRPSDGRAGLLAEERPRLVLWGGDGDVRAHAHASASRVVMSASS